METVFDEASSILLLSPSLGEGESDTCIELLHPDDVDKNALWVSYTKSPDAQLRRWRTHSEHPPASVGVVSVGDSMRSVSAPAPAGAGDQELNAGVETVANPNDLTGLGISITEHLSRWEDNGNRTVVCVDSLTAMLQYVELQTAYEFLHVLTGRLYATGAVAHFHMDPGAHDEQTVESIVSLCDAVVELRDGGRHVRCR
ncbi:DUF7504 family protein [Haloprofundus salinisoli]|uniref:DUF7504 family protein n=1 Tax=Haloprofundus salinisoli TaxID=2876193 RepID=UPI001CCB83AE|nr:hypothetical protein [Haloprofundus salinisoli]